MNSLTDVYLRVAAWNYLRYYQVYDQNLAVALLREEYNEWRLDTLPVKKLDGLCDVVYVALGVIWKADIDATMIGIAQQRSYQTVDAIVNAFELNPAYFINSIIDVLEAENDYPVEQAMMNIIALATAQALSMGLTQDQFIDALLVVCDSNDSKSVKKVASNIKANAGDKGAYFIPPEPRLQAILNKAEVFND